MGAATRLTPAGILFDDLTNLIRRRLGIEGLVYAFVAVDIVGAWLAGGALGPPATAAVSLVAVAVALAGFRITAPPGRRAVAVAALIVLLILLPEVVLISQQTAASPLHDGVLLTDAAGARLLRLENPYGHDYIDTFARTFYLSDVPVNFGLRHYVYMPGMVLLDLPVRLAATIFPRANFTWMFLPGLAAIAAGAALAGGRTAAGALAAVVVVVLNPLFQVDYLYSLNDLFVLAPLLASVGMARRDRAGWAGILFGAAISIKQQAILLLPLLVLYALLHWDPARRRRALLGATSVVALVVLPFALWAPGAFARDVAGFFYGSGVDAYPIRGLGLPGILLGSGAILNRWTPYPITSALQVGLSVLVILVAVRDLRRRWTWTRFWLWNAVLAGCVYFFGRVLAPNYLGLVVDFALLGLVSGLIGESPADAVAGGEDRPPGDGRVVGPAAVHDPGDLASGEIGGA